MRGERLVDPLESALERQLEKERPLGGEPVTHEMGLLQRGASDHAVHGLVHRGLSPEGAQPEVRLWLPRSVVEGRSPQKRPGIVDHLDPTSGQHGTGVVVERLHAPLQEGGRDQVVMGEPLEVLAAGQVDGAQVIEMGPTLSGPVSKRTRESAAA